jgi:hypothetical protein
VATKPVVTKPSITSFTCDQVNTFDIIGSKFSKNVVVDLAETRYLKDHAWDQDTNQYVSNASSASAVDGTCITVKSKPHKKDGSKCGGFPVGDLTITVTNNEAGTMTPSDPQSSDVTYS